MNFRSDAQRRAVFAKLGNSMFARRKRVPYGPDVFETDLWNDYIEHSLLDLSGRAISFFSPVEIEEMSDELKASYLREASDQYADFTGDVAEGVSPDYYGGRIVIPESFVAEEADAIVKDALDKRGLLKKDYEYFRVPLEREGNVLRPIVPEDVGFVAAYPVNDQYAVLKVHDGVLSADLLRGMGYEETTKDEFEDAGKEA